LIESEETVADRVPTKSPDTERQYLEALRRQLEAMLSGVDAKLSDLSTNSLHHSDKLIATPGEAQTSSRVPARQSVLDVLAELKCPAYTREIAHYAKARFGRTFPLTRFGTLVADEEKAFLRPGRRPRPVWIAIALTYDRHQPIKRLLTRSDWPLEMRIVAPTTGRVQHLWMTRRLCDLALDVGEMAVDPEMLKIIAADHARDVLGVKVRRGEFELKVWREAADAQLATLLPEDEHIRRDSAERLAARPERVQLFGIPEILEGGRVDHRLERGKA
jgi:hypothetical protein